VFEMTTSVLIEEESGTFTARFRHPHNGYYAGDFAEAPPRNPFAAAHVTTHLSQKETR
jgi:hypothetical protein